MFDFFFYILNRLSAAVVKNIFCPEGLYREVIIPAIDNSEQHSIRRQGIRLLSIVVDKIDEIYSMNIFDEASSLRSVLSVLSVRVPDLKIVAAFWKLEVDHLKTQELLEKETFTRQERTSEIF